MLLIPKNKFDTLIYMIQPKDLSIIFFGTPEFAVESLQAIIDAGYNVKAVVTSPDKPAGRGMQLHQSDVKLAAVRNNLPVLQPVSLKDADFQRTLRELNADLFVIIAFRMLPEAVWQMPELGTFNLHASLLPDYRGAAPINWAIINGETETGVTTFFLKHEIDTGDIISRKKTAIGPDENVGQLYDRLMKMGAELTLQTLSDICSGKLTTVAQNADKESLSKPAPKITKETARINWKASAGEIHNLVRGMSPYPCAWTEIGQPGQQSRTLKIYQTCKTAEACGDEVPGTIIIRNGRMFVATADEKLEILQIQLQGKKKMPVSDFLLGAKLENAKLI